MSMVPFASPGLLNVTVILALGSFTGGKTFARGNAPAKPSPRDCRLRAAPRLSAVCGCAWCCTLCSQAEFAFNMFEFRLFS